MTLSVVLPALLFGLATWQNRADLFAAAHARVERTSRILLEHARKAFETEKLVIDQVNGRLRYVNWQSETDRADLHRMLKALQDDLDQVATITITDAEGRMRASGRVYPADPKITFFDRDWYQALKAADSKIPFVSRSYLGRQSKQPVFNVAQRVRTTDGTFAGAIAVSIDRTYFEAFYREVEPTAGNVILLVRNDGKILAREPRSDAMELPANATFYGSLQRPPGTTYEALSSLDGIERIYAFRRIDPYPVSIGFGYNKSAVLAVWWRDVLIYALLAVAASLALLVVSAFAIQQSRRERLATLRWQAAAADLQAEAVEREQVEGRLRQSQKMEAVGQLTSGIAHDFNNMLAAIMGSLDLLSRRMSRQAAWDDGAQRNVDLALDASRSAANLTQRLLAFSRKQVLSPSLVDTNALVAGMANLIRRSIHADIRIETILADGVWIIHADANQLESVVLNLVINARDAMQNGGKLTIETGNCQLDEAYAAEHAGSGIKPGPYVMLSVTDTGSGMAPEVIARAFDPFFTTKAVGKGSGLGLSQVHGFVRQSHGHVEVDSGPGRGTIVRIYLPRCEGPLLAATDAPHRQDGPAQRLDAAEDWQAAQTVLIVEDEAHVRRVSADAFRELGFRVLEADGATAALVLLDTAPEVTLLFTDVVMPEVNGDRLAEEVRTRRPDIKVLFTTGYARDGIVNGGVLAADVDLISKPFTLAQLAAKVGQVFGRSAAA